MDHSYPPEPIFVARSESFYSQMHQSRPSTPSSISNFPLGSPTHFFHAPRSATIDFCGSLSSTDGAYSPAYTTTTTSDHQAPHQLPTSPHTPGAMSTMTAVQYDASSFGPMHPHARQSFTWPTAMEPSQMSGGHELPMSHLGEAHMGSETSSVRSLTNSPPRSAFSPEQREFKRHHDQARRDSKNSLRIRRTNSNPYAPQSPPLTLADTTSAMNMSIYSTAPAPMSLAEPATTLPSQAPYMQPYSPPLTEPTQYTPTFSPHMQHGGYALSTVDYGSPYSAPSSYDRQNSMPGMYSVPPVMPPSTMHDDAHVRVVQSRPKPQCWDHGCNGRQFSTFSNFLRHQREKSGQATKSVCPECGQSFTRSTARNGHLTQGKCRGRGSESGAISSPTLDEQNEDSSPEGSPMP